MTNKLNMSHPIVSDDYFQQWQDLIDLLAEFMEAPAALLTCINSYDQLVVKVKNRAPENPYQINKQFQLTGSGRYCEFVIDHQQTLFVANANEDDNWKDKYDSRLGMINYLGVPVSWPNGDPFGSLCVLDTKTHYYSELQRKMLVQLRNIFEAHLDILEKNFELEEVATTLEYLANTDDLTGIWNRRAFIAQAETELQRTSRHNRTLCLLMFDIDDFKRINDLHGHNTGDEAIKLFSECIMSSKRSYDIFGRIGGEEFAMVLPETDLASALTLAERMRECVEQLSLPLVSGEKVTFTVSIGLTEYCEQDDGIFALLSRADRNLYAAKHQGKNCVVS
ncbi:MULTISPECIES: sensor domain-containing diguanylate cyclase [unclassified Methylophaga]|uniref:sensor domain-containing diguanylate cyclase n=1 Tax=unclassified Methylophaga TaxID=2629249 RepID=UPI0025D4368C|nr:MULTISPECIES: sensor domain-containing diguanylate cyclase [unclassified Methylophaga]